MKVERIDHVHIAVKDLDKACKFFEDALGVEFSKDIFAPTVNTRSRMDPLGLEIVESTSPDGVIAKFIDKRGEGVQCVSFKVSDLDSAVNELLAKGVRLVGRVEVGNVREAQFYPKDSHGVMIELIEYKDIHGAAVGILGKFE